MSEKMGIKEEEMSEKIRINQEEMSENIEKKERETSEKMRIKEEENELKFKELMQKIDNLKQQNQSLSRKMTENGKNKFLLHNLNAN